MVIVLVDSADYLFPPYPSIAVRFPDPVISGPILISPATMPWLPAALLIFNFLQRRNAVISYLCCTDVVVVDLPCLQSLINSAAHRSASSTFQKSHVRPSIDSHLYPCRFRLAETYHYGIRWATLCESLCLTGKAYEFHFLAIHFFQVGFFLLKETRLLFPLQFRTIHFCRCRWDVQERSLLL